MVSGRDQATKVDVGNRVPRRLGCRGLRRVGVRGQGSKVSNESPSESTASDRQGTFTGTRKRRIRRLADPPVRRGPRVWDQSEYREGKGGVTRPVAFPEDIADPTIPKESGIVELPLHIHWWEPFRTYDLDDQLDRETVYREVLTEGTPDDVRTYIRLDELVVCRINGWVG